MNNNIHKIQLYRHNKGWSFDDMYMGVKEEALPFGFPVIIDKMINDQKITIVNFLFSAEEIPAYDTIFTKVNPEGLKIGAYYVCEKTNLVAWFCPAFDYYLKEFPDKLYIKIEKMFCETDKTTFVEISKDFKDVLDKFPKQTPLTKEERSSINEFFVEELENEQAPLD